MPQIIDLQRKGRLVDAFFADGSRRRYALLPLPGQPQVVSLSERFVSWLEMQGAHEILFYSTSLKSIRFSGDARKFTSINEKGETLTNLIFSK